MDPVAGPSAVAGVNSRPERRALGAWRCGSLLAACLLAGCAGPDGQARVAKPPVPAPSVTGTPDCFYAREVQDFAVIDRSNLIVYAPNDANAYHLRISPPSTTLRFADSIAFLPATGRVCGYAGDRLIVGQPTSAERLAIIDVARLSRGGLEILRGEPGASQGAPRPQPGAGAAIEGAVAPPAPGKADSGAQR